MKFYLIDDDKNVLHILKRIIRDRGLGEIAGTAENGVDALTDLPLINPDIVIVDLLMPEIDGITFVNVPALMHRILLLLCFPRLHPKI